MEREGIVKKNATIYDLLWEVMPTVSHENFSIWPEIQKEIVDQSRVLELGAGTLPHTPTEGGFFADVSETSLEKLRMRGGQCVFASGPLPFQKASFDVVCAFDVLEHIPDDENAMNELARILKPGGSFFFSVPVNSAYWTRLDALYGHVRRYDAARA